jgi:hypothetical protein
MPICKLGCDDLFERGYLVVGEGRVQVGAVEARTEPVRAYVDRVDGRPCEHWDEGSRPYFDYHRAYHTEG